MSVDAARRPSTSGRAVPLLARRWPVALAAAGASLIVLVGALLAGDAVEQALPGLPAPQELTTWGLPIALLARDLAAAVTVGCLLAAAFLVPGDVEGGRADLVSPAGYRYLQAAGGAALVWCLAAVAAILLTLSDLLGLPVDEAVSLRSLGTFVQDVPQGRALALVAVLTAVVATGARLAGSITAAALLAGLALVATLPPAFAGHAAGAGNHQLATSSLVLHVLGVTLWAGGLVALLLGRRLRQPELVAAVGRYSRLALACFALVGASGVLNAAVRLGDLGALVDSRYGLLVLGKATILAGVGVLGWLHRRATLPALRAGRPGMFGRLAAVEVLLFGAAVGLAVGLSRTAPPTAETTEDAAAALLGYPMPGSVTAERLALNWMPEPLVLTAVAGLAGLYLAGARRLARNGVGWPFGRTATWLAGCAVIVVATSSGLARYGPVLFSAHMVQHMLLTMLAPILLVLGAPVTLLLRAARRSEVPGLRGPREWTRLMLRSPVVRVLAHPLPVFAFWVGSLFAMYFTGAYELALRSHAAHLLMYGHFLLAGYLFFWLLIGPDPAPYRLPYPLRIIMLFAGMAFHAVFGLAIMQSTAIVAEDWFTALDRPWGPSLLADQRLGGGIAWVFGELPAMLVLVALLVQWIRSDEREARRLDRAADRAERTGVEDEHAAYNRYLARLADSDRRSGH